jgi:thiol-disulfide isomerase/thioredoxin
MPFARADDGTAAFEQSIAAATKSDKVTVVHFWAPWCPNCKHELQQRLERLHRRQPERELHLHHDLERRRWARAPGEERRRRRAELPALPPPEPSRKKGESVSQVLGLPVSWIPTTWVFKDGKITYAMNYGELRFPVLKQLIEGLEGFLGTRCPLA